MLTYKTIALPLSKARSIICSSGAGFWVSVKDRWNSETDLVPEYPLKTSVHCKADSNCPHQYNLSHVWNFSEAGLEASAVINLSEYVCCFVSS